MRSFFGVTFGLVLLASANGVVASDAGQQKPAVLDRTIKVTMKYLLYLPKDSWTETYNNPQLYEWLLQQKRMCQKPEEAKK